jgi:excisionase family DNA binding protein
LNAIEPVTHLRLYTPGPVQPHAFYTVKDIAKLLGLSYRTVWNMACDGRIKALRLPKHKRSQLRIPATELVRLLTPVQPLKGK